MGNKSNKNNKSGNNNIYILNKGSKFLIDFDQSDTIKNIKEKIFIKKNFATDLQILSYKSKILEDNKTTKHYKIKNNSTLDLEIKEISSPEEYFIVIKNHIDVDFYFGASSLQTIHDIKKIEFNHQNYINHKLIFFYKGEELEDSRTLYSYGLKGNKELLMDNPNYLDLYSLPSHGNYVLIKRLSGDKKPIFVPPTSSIENIKNKIFEIDNLPPKFQYLSFDNKVLDDNRTLAEYNIKNKSVVNLTLLTKNGIIVFVERISGRKIILEVQQSDPILIVKKKIEEIEHIKAERQSLCYEGKELEDNNIVSDYDIKPESIINIGVDEIGGIQLYVNTPYQKRVTLFVDEDDTIETLREILNQREGIGLDVESLGLIGKGKMLENSKTIKDYGIQNYSEIYSILRIRGG